jgi:membrane associated rhomboid family serine protease
VFRLPPLTPFVRQLLITLFAIFVLVAVAQNLLHIPVLRLFALDTTALSVATLWQLFTHVLVVPPTSVLPFFISLLFIWLILPPFEERYGAARVLQLALLATLCSAVLALLVGFLLPQYSAPIAGPETITLAAMSAYAVLLPPNAEISFFGVLPMKSQHLLYVVVGFSLLGFLTSLNATSLASDLGAIGAGVAFVKWWMQRPPPRRKTFSKRPSKPTKLRVVGRNDDDRPGGSYLN